MCSSDLSRGGTYLLSPSDMYLLEHLKELSQIGVDSLKIEGRMRSPEYVAAVTRIYKEALEELFKGKNRSIDKIKEDLSVMRAVYNRGDFTSAYLEGKSDHSLMSTEIPHHKGIEIGIVTALDVNRGHVEVKLSDSLHIGDGVEIRSDNDSIGNIITYMHPVKNTEKCRTQKKVNLIKEAEAGMRMVIGDLNLKGTSVKAGDKAFRTRDNALMKKLKQSYEKPVSRVAADMCFDGKVGSHARLTVTAAGKSGEISALVISDSLIEQALHKVTSEEDIKQQLSKTGGTPYILSDCKVNIYGEAAVPKSLINNMRRRALEELTEKRLNSWLPEKIRLQDANRVNTFSNQFYSLSKRQTAAISFNNAERALEKALSLVKMLQNRSEILYRPSASVFASDNKNGETCNANISSSVEIVLPYTEALSLCEMPDNQNFNAVGIVASLPVVMRSNMKQAAEQLMALSRSGKLKAVSLGHPSQIKLFEGCKELSLRFEQSANLYNIETFKYWAERGINQAVVSYELSISDIKDMIKFGVNSNISDMIEVTVYGRIPLMIMAHCPVACAGKGKCLKAEFALKDRKGAVYPLMPSPSNCSCTIMSYKPVNRISEYMQLKAAGICHYRISVFDEKPEYIYERVIELINS